MRLIAATATPYRLPLRRTWQAASGPMQERSGWLVCLRTDTGLDGYGECAPLPSHGSETHAVAAAALSRWMRQLPGQRVAAALAALPDPALPAIVHTTALTPQSLPNQIASPTPAARAAIECALLDLLAQTAGLPLQDFLRRLDPGAPPGTATSRPHIAVNRSAGALSQLDPATRHALQNLTEVGVCVAKLKLGLAPPALERQQLLTLLAQTPQRLRLRLDINRAWDAATATAFLCGLPAERIDLVEEPLHTASMAAGQPQTLEHGRHACSTLAALQARLDFPLALDESWPAWPASSLFADPPPVRRLVLKMAVCGGLLPALRLARRAEAAGIASVLSSGIDSACGILAAAQLAAVLPASADGAILAHGLATSTWLATDLGTPPHCSAGRLHLPPGPGLGFIPHPSTTAAQQNQKIKSEKLGGQAEKQTGQ